MYWAVAQHYAIRGIGLVDELSSNLVADSLVAASAWHGIDQNRLHVDIAARNAANLAVGF